MRKKFISLVCVLFSVGLIGCSSKEKITLWTPFTGPAGVHFEEIVEKYNATSPAFEIEYMPTPDMYTQIYTVMNSNDNSNVPDLLVGHIERIPLFKEQGMINDIEEVIKNQENLVGKNFLPQAWNAGEIDGKRYAIPLDIHSIILYYNEDLLNKYAPRTLDDKVITWDEILEIAPVAAQDGIVTFPSRILGWLVNSMVAQQGGNIHEGAKPTLNTAEALHALETLIEIQKVGGMQVDGDDAELLFNSGESIFIEEGIWYQNNLLNNEDFTVKTANTPVFTEDLLATWSSSHQFMELSKERTPEKQEAIGDFLEFVRLNSETWANGGQNVASVEVYKDDSYYERPQGFLMSNDMELNSMKIFSFLNYGIVDQSYGTLLNDAIYGRISAKEALDTAQKTAEDLLKEGN
ncbi:MAG: extracellular solute-binding protein [Lachnospirales bacterium]